MRERRIGITTKYLKMEELLRGQKINKLRVCIGLVTLILNDLGTISRGSLYLQDAV